MNRQEAIQQQIDEIMDAFDFQAVLKVLDVYKTMERGYPTDWVLDGEFFEPSVRAAARACMKAAAKELDFITAAQLRDEMLALKRQLAEKP